MFQSFYSKNALTVIDKDGSLINSTAFIGFFVLFCLAFGLFLYQLTAYYKVSYHSLGNFELFASFSTMVAIIFAVKYVVLKFIGFIFDIDQPVSRYIAILNMTYFNVAFVLLVVTICFSLLAVQFIPVLLLVTEVIIAVIFAWQFVRNSLNMISDFRFHKFYLFIYLCALEICPILVLIKALDI